MDLGEGSGGAREALPRAIYEWIEDKKLAMIRDERNRMLVLAKAVVRLSHEIRPGRPRGNPTRRP
ncbi:hypothetical protein [Microbacterium sp. 13-71-7]|uniref:hypothetical protein n=1 Tax=Microbacterium sp. 13-71-7 TaxID=1970399 RepID=UPI000BDB88B5|nr:hypothetical protein [Microbacterium sp. 13-71-7]OZB81765.1 MAG: hypothetical protein B7X32_15750 [Microbacterium sp. 13-71-7]